MNSPVPEDQISLSAQSTYPSSVAEVSCEGTQGSSDLVEVLKGHDFSRAAQEADKVVAFRP